MIGHPPAPSAKLNRGNFRSWQCGALLVMFLSGCGYDEYREQLGRTVKYYEYVEYLNANLDATWSGEGMKWRPPKKMTTSAGPGLRPYNEDSKKFENIPDPRQPVSPPFRVTGIVGAWTTEVTLDVAEGAVAGTGYIFLVSNGDRYRYDEPKPANFFEDLENELMECFHVTIQMGDGKASDNNIHYPIMIPLSDEWGKTQNYRAVHLVPEKEINKVAWIVDLFELQGTDVQSAVVVMYPAKAKERITEKVRIAMETLEVEPKPPELRLPPPKEGVPGGPGVPLLPGAAPAKPSGF